MKIVMKHLIDYYNIAELYSNISKTILAKVIANSF